MHRRLFSFNRSHFAPMRDAAVWNALRTLRNTPELAPFRLFLVGSRLDPENETSDIDLILAPRSGSAFGDYRIERALLHCREYGLFKTSPSCLIDPGFRRQGPSVLVVPLAPTTVLQTAKLFSPKLVRLVSGGAIRDYRRFGRFSIEYSRQAGESDFYQKLPRQRFNGVLCPYLRPAIEVIV
jgi:hypothetical protein